MTFSLALRRLLPLLAVVSLALAPVTASAAVAGMRAPAAMQGHAMAMPDDELDGMAVSAMDEMPCCPQDGGAVPDCSKGCPLMALCLAKIASGLPTVIGLPLRVAVVAGPAWGEPVVFDSLTSAPSPEPPRS